MIAAKKDAMLRMTGGKRDAKTMRAAAKLLAQKKGGPNDPPQGQDLFNRP